MKKIAVAAAQDDAVLEAVREAKAKGIADAIRVNTKKEALKVGRECNQISILNWRTMGLVYC